MEKSNSMDDISEQLYGTLIVIDVPSKAHLICHCRKCKTLLHDVKVIDKNSPYTVICSTCNRIIRAYHSSEYLLVNMKYCIQVMI